jgi:ribosomal protein S27E
MPSEVITMFQKIGDSIRRFMSGRNGVDTLAWTLCIAGIVLNLIGSFSGLAIFTFLAYIPLILAMYRVFSRDVSRRYEENQKFQQFFARIKGRKNYCYFKCPGCKTRVRVPKGKGKIKITCPSCRETFVKKT